MQFYVTIKKLKFLYMSVYVLHGCYVCGMNSISICTHIYTSVATFQQEDPSMLQYILYHLPAFSVLLLMFLDKVKNSEIVMKPNQAYETVTLPSPSQSATHVHTKPCPAYEVVVQAHH